MLTLDTPIKFLRANGDAPIGRGSWHLPQDGQPGAWMKQYKTPPILCVRGYHFTTVRHAMEHADARMFLIKTAGDVIHDTTKSVAQGARLLSEVATWNARTQRLFAADCAESVLHLIAKAGQNDSGARRAIEVARLHANNKATDADLCAAGAAARDAAWDAAGAAAGAAAWDAARSAARAAAWDAAWAAAWDAARSAARQWQAARLLAYLNGQIG